MKINDWSCTQGSSSIKERCERTRVSCASTWNAVVPINVLAPQQQGNITCVLFEPLQLHSTLFAGAWLISVQSCKIVGCIYPTILHHILCDSFVLQFCTAILKIVGQICPTILWDNFALGFSAAAIRSCTPVFMWFGFSNCARAKLSKLSHKKHCVYVRQFCATFCATVLHCNFVLQFRKLSDKNMRPLNAVKCAWGAPLWSWPLLLVALCSSGVWSTVCNTFQQKNACMALWNHNTSSTTNSKEWLI